MKINKFFSHRLHAPLYHHLWSWGAYDDHSDRVFLRVGEQSIVEDTDGDRWLVVHDPNWRDSNGRKERFRHLDLIRQGVAAFAVIVQFDDSGHITRFDDETLFVLGDIVEEDGLTYAKVIGERPVEEIAEYKSDIPSMGPDLEKVTFPTDVPQTVKQALVDARQGQGKFRRDVLRQWDYECAVTGVAEMAVIRASHIKPWRESSDEERLDPLNGLPLVATLDALFDVGLISFSRDGKLIQSPRLNADDSKTLGLHQSQLRTRPPKRMREYLAYHRRIHQFSE